MDEARASPGKPAVDYGFRVGDVRVDPVTGVIWGPGGREQVDPRVMAVFMALVRKAGLLVTREELQDAVWAGRAVTDDVLSRSIYQLRRHLVSAAGDAALHDLIETLPKRGYRLLAPVIPIEDAGKSDAVLAGSRRTRVLVGSLAVVLAVLFIAFFSVRHDIPGFLAGHTSPATEGLPANSVAVLAFADMSAAGDQEYFADGLAEEIINLLARINDLKVIGRTSSFAFKDKDASIPEIGRALGVDHILEGSVRKAGERVRITAQLLKADDGSHLWSETYDRQLTDIFIIQEEIAAAIADELQVKLADETHADTQNLAAYDLYLKAHALIQSRSRDKLERARSLIDQALHLDPDYAPALAASGMLWLLLSDFPAAYGDIPVDQAVVLARPAIEKALALDPGLAEAHAVLGLLHMLRYDYTGALIPLRRALELNPGLTSALHWQAVALAFSGRLRDAIAARKQIAERDPLFPANLHDLADHLAKSGEFESALQIARRLQTEHPNDYLGYHLQAEVLRYQGRLAEAAKAIGRARTLDPGNTIVASAAERIYFSLGDYPRALEHSRGWLETPIWVALGQTEAGLARARARLAVSPGNLATLYSRLYGLALAGRHAELLEFVKQRWGGVAGLGAEFGYEFAYEDVLGLVAAAQRLAGQADGLAETLALWDRRLATMEDNGYVTPDFLFGKACFHAVSGKRDAALAGLIAAIDAGYRNPLLHRRPEFKPWASDPDLRVQIERMKSLINIERAKLGLEPLA